MPDEDEKNLRAIPASSDSVPPPGDEASTIVTEFPQHLIEALAQKAGIASHPPPALTPTSVPVGGESSDPGAPAVRPGGPVAPVVPQAAPGRGAPVAGAHAGSSPVAVSPSSIVSPSGGSAPPVVPQAAPGRGAPVAGAHAGSSPVAVSPSSIVSPSGGSAPQAAPGGGSLPGAPQAAPGGGASPSAGAGSRMPTPVSPLATVEVPVVVDVPPVPSSRRPRALPSLLQVPDARGPVAATPFTEAVTPAMGSPRFGAEARTDAEADDAEDDDAEAEIESELVLEDSHLEPYESPRALENAPLPRAAAELGAPPNALAPGLSARSAPAAAENVLAFAPTESALAAAPSSATDPEPEGFGFTGVGVETVVDPHPLAPLERAALAQSPAAGAVGAGAAGAGAAGAHAPPASGVTGASGAAHPPTTPFAFSPPRPAVGYGASKSGAVWAEPPPPVILMDPPTSALGWAIGGIIVGLLLLALIVWLLVVLVRHLL
ncbi:hypothetical protein [Pendulispora albinea]|uniref:Uncharacterized protein n=1 Tax=Pendulispora albinea TaxID=2741071 RepID=A0ABZ2LNQ1_9BACT